MASRAVFLDKDGTLVENVPYNVDQARIRLLSGVGEGLRLLQAAGLRLFIVSNQSGVARGYFPEEALAPVRQQLDNLLAPFGVSLSGFYYCPHLPDGILPEYAVECACRKPAPGLLLRAAREHDLDLGNSWCIGDNATDIKAGRRAGCRTVLVGQAGTEHRGQREPRPDYVVPDLRGAARIIANRDLGPSSPIPAC